MEENLAICSKITYAFTLSDVTLEVCTEDTPSQIRNNISTKYLS